MPSDDKDIKEKIYKLILDSVQADKVLRDQYQVGEKFKFIRDRLLALKTQMEEEIQAAQQEATKTKNRMTEDEVVVYVYLYNAQGLAFNTWQKMINASVLYEYSVNRPIYSNYAEIESFIRSRSDKAQHGILAMVIKKEAILSNVVELPKDQIGNVLIKIKEGSLQIHNIVAFIYQDNQYVLNNLGQLIKKEE